MMNTKNPRPGNLALIHGNDLRFNNIVSNQLAKSNNINYAYPHK